MVAHTLIPALGRQRQADFFEFKTNLVYRVSSRTARATQRNPFSEKRELNRSIVVAALPTSKHSNPLAACHLRALDLNRHDVGIPTLLSHLDIDPLSRHHPR